MKILFMMNLKFSPDCGSIDSIKILKYLLNCWFFTISRVWFRCFHSKSDLITVSYPSAQLILAYQCLESLLLVSHRVILFSWTNFHSVLEALLERMWNRKLRFHSHGTRKTKIFQNQVPHRGTNQYPTPLTWIFIGTFLTLIPTCSYAIILNHMLQ